MNEQIQGAIERITYFNEDNGYSVIKISPDKPYPRAQARDGTVTVDTPNPDFVSLVDACRNLIREQRDGSGDRHRRGCKERGFEYVKGRGLLVAASAGHDKGEYAPRRVAAGTEAFP